MKEKNKNSFLKNFMLVIITALITCILTTIVVYNAAIAPKTIQSDNVISNIANGIITSLKGKEEQVSLEQKTSDIKKKLEEIYIGDIDEKKMIDGALEGYVAALGDEYTEYLTEEEVTSIMEDVNGAYVGVGLYITQNVESNEILVIGVIEDSPANKAGILVGDVVKKVDDTEYTGEQLTQASNKMKGVEGTKVKVMIKK